MKRRLHQLNSSIFTKISLLTAAVFILVSILSTALLLVQLSANIQDKDRILVREAGSKIYSFFQDCYTTVYNQRTLVHSTGHIAETIGETRDCPSDIYSPRYLSKITNYMSALTYADPAIEDVILFTADGENSFSYSARSGRTIYLGYDFNSLSYIQDFQNNSNVIAAVYDPGPAYFSVASSPPVISFIIKINRPDAPQDPTALGYLIVNYSLDTVDEVYNEITEASDGDYYVLNRDSCIIYSNMRSCLGSVFSGSTLPDNSLISDKNISLSGIRVIASLDKQKLKESTNDIIRQFLFIIGIGIAVSVLIVFLVHRYYAKRFRSLADAMDNISNGNFSQQLPEDTSDEIGYLSRSFNTMSRRLNEYIRKNYLAETQRRTAELYALQAQINPHFLANTIESIRMSALESNAYEVAEMLQQLGSLFRWMIRFDQDIIYLEDELEYIQCYLDLQRYRFMDRLNVSIDVPAEIYYYGIPRFTLQPVVENALSHGSPNTHPLHISICFEVVDEIMVITVEDNGPGMTEDEVRDLNDHIRGIRSFPRFGVALHNICTRISLLFGEPFGLSVSSVYCQGTTVTITLPAKEKKELENYVQITNCR